MKKNKKAKLDSEEKQILASFENNEWKTVKDLEKTKTQARKMAAETSRINNR